MIRRRLHRHHKQDAEINITAFMNLMVVLVPFLLITAVFSRITTLNLHLPEQAANSKTPPPKTLQLEVIIRKDGSLELGDHQGGLIRRMPATAEGYDLATLTGLLKQIKAKYPAKNDITLLLEPDVEYDALVQIMDAVRITPVAETAEAPAAGGDASSSGETPRFAELFPVISIGDAPPRLGKRS